MKKELKHLLISAALAPVASFSYIRKIDYTYSPNECFQGFDPSGDHILLFTEQMTNVGFPIGFMHTGGCAPQGADHIFEITAFSYTNLFLNIVINTVAIFTVIWIVRRIRNKKNDKQSKTKK